MINLMYVWRVKPMNRIGLLRQALSAGLLYLAAVFCLFLPLSSRSQVVINEIMADNATTVPTRAGAFADWIELYNSGAVSVNLFGYSLTDTPTNTQKFVFTNNVLLDPHGYLMVWCDSTSGPDEFHTGFNLKASGEFVGLYPPTGQVDAISFGLQVTDLSIGRIPDGPTGIWTLNKPTPLLSNRSRMLGSIATLKINEWVATNATGGADWLELYNPASDPVALAGLEFTSTLAPTVPADPPIANLSFIDAVGFIQFHCVGNKAKTADDLFFKLSHTSGETVTLYSHSGTSADADVIDRISFPGDSTIPNYWPTDAANVGVSYGRLPDGGTNIVQFARNKTTPGASNFQSITNVVINRIPM